MAEERYLGVARAPEADEDSTDSTKAELQRRMEEARESITQTVSEIKDTVTNQYQSVRESVSEALDWREQYRKRPLAWNLGALGVGIVVGYSLGGAVIGNGDDDDRDSPASDETDAYDRTGATPAAYPAAQPDQFFPAQRAYAPQAIAEGAYGSSEYAAADAAGSSAASRPSYSSGYEQTPEEEKPGLVERFKETRAYDRLQEEVSELGNRFMDELSNAARTIVLPALFNKIKELVGVDLSNKPHTSVGSTRQASAPAQTNAQAAAPASTGSAESSQPASSGTDASTSKASSAASAGGGSEVGNRNSGFGYDDRYERESQLYARSENRGFGAQAHGETGTSAKDAAGTDREGTERGGTS